MQVVSRAVGAARSSVGKKTAAKRLESMFVAGNLTEFDFCELLFEDGKIAGEVVSRGGGRSKLCSEF